MARRVQVAAPEPEYVAPSEVVTGPAFTGLDPRVAVLHHPADWPVEARRRHAAAISAGMAAGWWSGIRPRSRRDWMADLFEGDGEVAR